MNENVNVCITPKGDKPVLHFSQFDNENVFTVTVLADDGESAAVLTGLDIEFRLRKTDSHVVTIAPESVANNVITFKTTEQLCACCGQNIATVTLLKDDMVISTLDILVDIQRDILSGGLTSESDIRNLTTQIEQIVPEVIGDDYYNKQEVDDLLAEHTFDPSNYYDKSDVDDLLDDKADADDVYTKSDVYNKTETDNLLSAKMDSIGYHGIVDDASVISFTTDCNAPLDIIKGKITPVQDLHGYSKPWSGGSGKNKFNDTTGTHTINANTDVTLAIGDVYLEANTTYTISCKQTPAPLTSFVRNTLSVVGGGTTTYNPAGNDYTIKPMVFTPTVSGTYSVRVWGHTLSANTTYSQFQVEKGATATAYEPYSNICPISGFSALNVTLADGDMQTVESKTVNFGQTVYGGVADIANGKVNITRNIVDLSTLNWVYASGAKRWEAQKTDMKNYPLRNADIIFEKYETDTGATVGSEGKGFISGLVIYVTSNDSTTRPSGNACYPLATPIEITTTPETVPSIAGANNIFLDTGNLTEIAYFENAEDNLIKLIKACQI